MRLEFTGNCLKQDKVTYTHGAIIKFCIVYELISSTGNAGITLKNCLFGAIQLTKNADVDK